MKYRIHKKVHDFASYGILMDSTYSIYGLVIGLNPIWTKSFKKKSWENSIFVNVIFLWNIYIQVLIKI